MVEVALLAMKNFEGTRERSQLKKALALQPSQTDADAFLSFATRLCGRPPRAAGSRPASAPEELDAVQRAAAAAAPRPLPGFGVPPPDEPAALRGAGAGERPLGEPAGARGIRPLPDVSVMMSQICGKAVLSAPGRTHPEEPARQQRAGRATGKWDQLTAYRGKVDAVLEIRQRAGRATAKWDQLTAYR